MCLRQKTIAAFLSFILIFSSFSLFIGTFQADAAPSPNLNLQAGSAILMDAHTGDILFAMNENEAKPPASMAKMMTEYLVMESIKQGKISWDDVVTVSRRASETIGSKIFLAEGDKHTVRELFIAMAVGSANDASVALAEYVAGSEEEFAKRMNEKAKELGLSEKAHFINATGLGRADMGPYAPDSIPGETLLTAKDAALLAYHIIHDHPEVLEITKMPNYKFRERDDKPMVNYNWMVEANKDNVYLRTFAYEGMDGLKTGHTDEAGYCFTGTAERNGLRLISVVMNTSGEAERFEETRKLMDYGFNNFERKTFIKAKTELVQLKEVPIKKGVSTTVPVVADGNIEFTVEKGAVLDNYKIETVLAEESQRIAPIKKGAVVGTVKVTAPDGTVKQVNLVANEDVEKGSFIRLFFRALKTFVGNMFQGIVDGIKNLF